MTQPLNLTDAEVDDLTRGLKQPAAKVRYLRGLGFRVERRPDGTPLVFRETPPSTPKLQSANGPRFTK